MRRLRWLIPGMGIKRWIFMSIAGVILAILGAFLLGGVKIGSSSIILIIAGLFILLVGLYFIVAGIRELVRFIISMLLPQREGELVDIVYAKRHLSKGPNIVTIGGGTGLSVLLHGLKKYTSNISAIVTVADDGGSSGRLRREFDVLPPGDIRDCLVALADAEPLMGELFQFRFEKESELGGHNFGNLFITAMTKLTGDFEKAIKASSRILAIRGQVIPSTLRKITLIAKHKNGETTRGETKISEVRDRIDKIYLDPPHCEPAREVIEAINRADAIILGPGSLYTSIIPNLLVKGVSEAISNSNAPKIYVCNVMTQSHETDGYTASEHVEAIISHTNSKIIDYVIVNTQEISHNFRAKYEEENAHPVVNDLDKIREMGHKVIAVDVINTVDHVRHNSEKLTRIIIDLISDITAPSGRRASR
ncbi:MAG: YvcK family protein [Candidatus Omnitrophica bacterium]|nr:YvcK family protein [Candidatus Omnitrophota bacterium]